jgi:hypothetical protein
MPTSSRTSARRSPSKDTPTVDLACVSVESDSARDLDSVVLEVEAMTPKVDSQATGSKFFCSGKLAVMDLSGTDDTLKGMSDAGSEAGGPVSADRSKYLRSSRKRAAASDEVKNSSDSQETKPSRKPRAAKRGCGRPPTSDHYVGLAEAKAKAAARKRAEITADL